MHLISDQEEAHCLPLCFTFIMLLLNCHLCMSPDSPTGELLSHTLPIAIQTKINAQHTSKKEHKTLSAFNNVWLRIVWLSKGECGKNWRWMEQRRRSAAICLFGSKSEDAVCQLINAAAFQEPEKLCLLCPICWKRGEGWITIAGC